MEPRQGLTCTAAVLLFLGTGLLALPQASGQDTIPVGPDPVFLRGDQTGRIEAGHATGRLLLHAGSETVASVRITHGDGEPIVEQSGRSWRLVTYPLPGSGEARVASEGAVWVAALTGPIHEGAEVTFGCDAVGSHMFWSVSAAAVQIRRSGPEAPVVVRYEPMAGAPTPDAVGVKEHTFLVEPGGSPFYLRPETLGRDCAGTTVLERVREPNPGPLTEVSRLLVWLLLGVGAVVAIFAYGVWLMARDRERHRRMFRRERGR